MTKPKENRDLYKARPADLPTQELTCQILSLRPEKITDRDFNILVECLFATEETVGARYNLTRDAIHAVKRRHRPTWKQLTLTADRVIPAMAERAVFEGVKKASEFMGSDKATPKDHKDAMMLVQTTSQLAKIAKPEGKHQAPKAPQLPSASDIDAILEIEPIKDPSECPTSGDNEEGQV